MNLNEINITDVTLTLITLFAGIITCYVIPYLRAKLDEKKFNDLKKWTIIAVKAADQLAKSGVIDLDQRRARVLKFLKSKGFTINMDEINMLIEAIVSELPHIFSERDQFDPEYQEAMHKIAKDE